MFLKILKPAVLVSLALLAVACNPLSPEGRDAAPESVAPAPASATDAPLESGATLAARPEDPTCRK